jgi:ABC-2 type transport system permease protein
MIFAQLRLELAELYAAGRLRWLVLALALLTLASVLSGATRQAEQSRHRAQAERASYSFWLDQGDKNPHSAAHFGMHVARPLEPAAFFDPGLTPFTGISIWVEAHKQNAARFRAAQDGTGLARFPDLSPAFLLQVIAPLVAILLGYASVAAERERGRLRFVLGQGAAPWPWLCAKTLAVVCALGVCLAPLALVPVAGTLTDAGAGAATQFGRALGLAAGLALAYALYLLAFCALSVAVSALARRPAAALAGLVAFWACACVLAPRLATGLAAEIAPAPEGYAFRQDLQRDRKLAEQRLFPEEGMSEFERATLEKHGVKGREQLPFSMRGALLMEEEAAGDAVFDRYYGMLWSRWREQARWTLAAGLASPLPPLMRASQGYAGTGLEHELNFLRAAENYRRSVQHIMNADLRAQAAGREYTYKAGRELWASVPAFRYPSPSLGEIWQAQLAPLTLLALWCGAAFVLLNRAARRLGAR